MRDRENSSVREDCDINFRGIKWPIQGRYGVFQVSITPKGTGKHISEIGLNPPATDTLRGDEKTEKNLMFQRRNRKLNTSQNEHAMKIPNKHIIKPYKNGTVVEVGIIASKSV